MSQQPGAPLPMTEQHEVLSKSDALLIDQLRVVVPEVMRANQTPGLAIAVSRHGRTVWEAGFGLADLSTARSMTPDTVFRSGSMGKAYTGVAVMQLVESGHVNLEEAASAYLPFEVSNPLGGVVTLRHLMTHRSGLAAWDQAGATSRPPRPLAQVLAEAYASERLQQYAGSYSPLWTSPVDAGFQYSGIGAATLGLVVERMNPHGLSYGRYIDERIVAPLGMRFTQTPERQSADGVRPDIWQRRSEGYLNMGGVWLPTPELYYACTPAGAFMGTPGDHVRLLAAMLAGGAGNGARILSRDSVRAMLTPCSEQRFPLGGYQQGLIWALEHWGGSKASFGHSGTHAWGWRNASSAWVHHDTAVVIASNQITCPHRAGDVHQLVEFIGNWLVSAPPPVERESGADWARKLSYCRGLIAVEAVNGWLGLADPLDEASFKAMVKGAQLSVGLESAWDPEGFMQGVRDLLRITPTEDALRGFLASAECGVALEDLEQALYELGAEPGRVAYLSHLVDAVFAHARATASR